MKIRLIYYLSFFLLIFSGISCNSQNSKKQDSVVTKDTIFEISDYVKSAEKSVIIKPQEEAKYKYVKKIPTPQGFIRTETGDSSANNYFRNLELKTKNNLVYLHTGELKGYQGSQFAVLKIDVGKRDLQQCADAVMRLRGELLFSQKKYSDIHFNFLSDGKPRYFTNYANGNLSQVKFRKYMDYIFSYANTGSLKNELKKIQNPHDIKIGDVFIQKGTPYGHAITVMDIAKNKETGDIVFMLSQSYMPAQEIHILKNPNNKEISPWYVLKNSGVLETPEWTFYFSDLMSF